MAKQLRPDFDFPDFFVIPGYNTYSVNESGIVLNKKEKRFLTGSKNPAGYVNYRLKNDHGIVLTWGRHRLLAYVFLNPGCEIDDLIVNHKNGIKGDDRLDNLEWGTHRYNIEHAGANGLTSKCTPVSIRNPETKEVFNFPSVIACARALGLSKDGVSYRVKIGDGRVFPEGLQYRLSALTTPWSEPGDLENALLDNGTIKAIVVKNILTGQEKIYEKISDLASEINTAPSTLTQWLKREDQPVLPSFIQMQILKDKKPWRSIEDPVLELSRFTGKRPVTVKDAITGHEVVFESSTACAKTYGLGLTTLHHRLSSKSEKSYDGKIFSYYKPKQETSMVPLVGND